MRFKGGLRGIESFVSHLHPIFDHFKQSALKTLKNAVKKETPKTDFAAKAFKKPVKSFEKKELKDEFWAHSCMSKLNIYFFL